MEYILTAFSYFLVLWGVYVITLPRLNLAWCRAFGTGFNGIVIFVMFAQSPPLPGPIPVFEAKGTHSYQS
jgi:hypothetical protein